MMIYVDVQSQEFWVRMYTIAKVFEKYTKRFLNEKIFVFNLQKYGASSPKGVLNERKIRIRTCYMSLSYFFGAST